jgi:hypothetical protein
MQSCYRLYRAAIVEADNLAEAQVVRKGKITGCALTGGGAGGGSGDVFIQFDVVKNTGGNQLNVNNPQREQIVSSASTYVTAVTKFEVNHYRPGLAIDVEVGDRLILAADYTLTGTSLNAQSFIAADIYVVES